MIRSRRRRRLGLFLVAAVTLAGGLAGAGGASAGVPTGPAAPARFGQAPADDPAAGLDDLASCVSQNGRLLVQLLVDESGSLLTTDPQNQRVAAAKSALSSLSSLTEPSAGATPPQVEVSLGGFAADFESLGEFTPLNAATLPRLQQDVDQFSTRNTGIDTDFAHAISGAGTALDRRSKQLSANGAKPPCRAILLFTDGQFDLGLPRPPGAETKDYAPDITITDRAGVDAAIAKGVDALCRKDGIADDIRSGGVSIVAVPLASAIDAKAQAFLQALATSTGPGGTKCGSKPGNPRGAYLPAADLSSLVQRFDQAANQIGGGTIVSGEGQQAICQGAPCADRRREFAVDRSVARVHLLLTVPTPAVQALLKLPGVAQPLTLADRQPGEAKVGTATAKFNWLSPTEASVDVVLPAGQKDWPGTWVLTFVDPTSQTEGQPASSQLSLFGTVKAELVGDPSFRLGEPGQLTARLVGSAKGKAPDNVAKAEIVATVTDPTSGAAVEVPLADDGKGSFTGSYTPPADLTTSVLEVTLRSTVTTDTGVVLTSGSPAFEANLLKPGTYPQITPARLVLPGVEGTDAAKAELVVTAAPQGAGCVKIEPLQVQGAPAASQPVALTVDGAPPGPCIPVKANQIMRLQVELKPAGRANGIVRGILPITVTSNVDPRPLRTDLAFQFPVKRGVDTKTQIVAAIALLAAGLLLPLAGLVLMNSVSTRFQDLAFVQGASVPVVVRKDRILRPDPESGALSPLALHANDFENLEGAGESAHRHFTWTGLDFVARSGLNPFAEGHAVVAPEGGAADLKGREGTKVDLDLGLAGSWLFLLDQDATSSAATGRTSFSEPAEVHGRLVAFIADGSARQQLRRLLPDINKRLPQTARRLTELAQAAVAKHKPAKSDKKDKKDGADKGAKGSTANKGREGDQAGGSGRQGRSGTSASRASSRPPTTSPSHPGSAASDPDPGDPSVRGAGHGADVLVEGGQHVLDGGAPQGLLGAGVGAGAQPAQAAGLGDGGGHHGVGRDRRIEEAGGDRLVGGVDVALHGGGHEPLAGQPVAGQFDREDGQRHADGHLVQPDLEVARGSDAGVAGQQGEGAGGQGVAGARRHRGQPEPVEADQQAGSGGDQLAHALDAGGHGGQVEAGREPPRPAHDDHGAGLGLGSVEGGVQADEELGGDGVGLAVVEGHHGDAVVDAVGGRDGRSIGHGPHRSGAGTADRWPSRAPSGRPATARPTSG